VSGSYLTAQQALRLLEGFQSGDLDHLDLQCIFEDPAEWLADSDSWTARVVRGEE